MLFNSLHFALFFPVITGLFFLLPPRWRAPLLLAASCYFYMAFVPAYILILFFTIAVDFASGILIERASLARRKAWLAASLTANIGVLAVFKYYDFLAGNFSALAHAFGAGWNASALGWVLPIGLSFHTFQSMAYTIEVYYGRQKAERNLLVFALYVMFYPQLVAGPIERPEHLLAQIHAQESFTFDEVRASDGLRLMLWGLLKKVVIADRLAAIVDAAYSSPSTKPGFALLVATYLFAIQIYCDFSGYSDIAIGAAQVMGFKLAENFRRPYLAPTIGEFWRRWHISLSTWFRDYLYIPLGGNRVESGRRAINLMIVFLVSGLWHGASWTFVVWGALHGAYLVVGDATRGARNRAAAIAGLDRAPRLRLFLQRFAVFQLSALAWIFFRAKSMTDACTVVRRITLDLHPRASGVVAALGGGRRDLVFAGILVAALFGLESLQEERGALRHLLARKPRWVRWGVYYAALIVAAFAGAPSTGQFIYFQF